MAEKLKVCQQAYSKLEKGKIKFTPQRISQICNVFKLKEKDFMLLEVHLLPKSFENPLKNGIDELIVALNRHYEILLLESELRNVKLEQKIRNYKPFQCTTGKDTPLVYVMI